MTRFQGHFVRTRSFVPVLMRKKESHAQKAAVLCAFLDARTSLVFLRYLRSAKLHLPRLQSTYRHIQLEIGLINRLLLHGIDCIRIRHALLLHRLMRQVHSRVIQ